MNLAECAATVDMEADADVPVFVPGYRLEDLAATHAACRLTRQAAHVAEIGDFVEPFVPGDWPPGLMGSIRHAAPLARCGHAPGLLTQSPGPIRTFYRHLLSR